MTLAGLVLGAIVLVIKGRDGQEKARHRLAPGDTVQVIQDPPSPDIRAANPPLASKDRDVALWVFEKGGQITIHGREKTVDRPSDLPDAPFQVTMVHLLLSPDVVDRDMSRFTGLSLLQGLYLAGSQLSDEGLATIGTITTLKYLALASPRITDAGLQHLSGLKNIENLLLGGTSIGTDGLAHLVDLPLVNWLDLTGTKAADSSLALMPRFRSLEGLVLRQTGVTDEGLPHLMQVPKLKRLDLEATNVSDDGLATLKQLSSLRELVLTGTRISPRGVEALRAALPNCKVDY